MLIPPLKVTKPRQKTGLHDPSVQVMQLCRAKPASCCCLKTALRFSFKASGLTPYRMLRGRDYSGMVVEIGECVLYKKPIAPKLVALWEK